MARIAGVDLPRNKHVNIALTYIYGIGHPRAARILDAAKVDPMKKVQDLGEEEVNRIRQVIEAEGAAHRNRLLSRIPPPSQFAGSRPAHAYKRAYPQRATQGNCRQQKEGGFEDLATSSQFSVS